MKLKRRLTGAAMMAALLFPALSAVAKDREKEAEPEPPQVNSAPCLTWAAPGNVRGVLLCIHGLGLYSGAYANFGQRMANLGITTYAIDVRGFGSWMKAHGDTNVDFDAALVDIKTALQAIRSANPKVPVFILGESMGGAIALRAASMYPDLVNGLISSVPAGDRFKQKSTNILVAFRFLKGPNKEFPIGEKIVEQATDNPELKKDWLDDPLNRMDLSPKELMQFQKFMNENHKVAPKIGDIPVLVVQGNKDKLVKPEGTWQVFNEIGAEQKTFLAVPSEHLIFENQQDDASVFDKRIDQLVSSWLIAHLAPEQVLAALPTVSTDPAIAKAIEANLAGNYEEALHILKPIIMKDPKNADAHYWSAVALMKENKSLAARGEFIESMHARHAAAGQSQSANNYLLSMQAPDKVAEEKQSEESLAASSQLAGGKNSIVAFYAPWAEQCNCVDELFDKTKKMYGDKINLVKVNVDDASSVDAVKALDIGPIPTFVFLKSDGSKVSTLLGTPDFVNFAKDLGKLGLAPAATK